MASPELRGIHILASLTDGQLTDLMNYGEMIEFPASQRIVNQGEKADAMFMLVSGRVAAFVRASDGSESHLRTSETGGHFGEIGLLEEGIRTASVRAEINCRVFRLHRDSFRLLLKKPELAAPLLYNISRSLAMRLADITSRLSEARAMKDTWMI